MPFDFDIEGARKAGATDADIADYFKTKYNVDFDFGGARKSGSSDADILGYLNTKYGQATNGNGKPPPPVDTRPSTDGIHYSTDESALQPPQGNIAGITEDSQKGLTEKMTKAKLSLRDEYVFNTIERKNESLGKKTDKNSVEYKKQAKDLIAREAGGDVVQHSADDGKRFLIRSSGFKEAAGNAFIESIKAPIDAAKMVNLEGKELADFLDKKAGEQPYLPESAPSPFSGALGGALGGLPKVAALFGINAIPGLEGVGTLAATAEAEFSSTGVHTAQLYHKGLQELLDDGVPLEQARIQAANKAKKDAPLVAAPDAFMTAALGTEVMGNMNTAAKGVAKALGQVGKSAAKFGVAGTGAGLTKAITEKAQGYDISMQEALDMAGEEGFQYATMDAMFKIAPLLPKMPGHVQATVKEYFANVPKPVFEEATAVMGEEGETLRKEQAKYEKARETVKDVVAPEDLPVFAGLVEKKQALEAKKKTTDKAFHPEIDAEIEAIDQKIEIAKNSKDPSMVESDNLTGEHNLNPKLHEDLTKPEREGIKVPTDYGGVEVIEKGEGENKTFTPKAWSIEEKGGLGIKKPIKIEGEAFNDKAKAKEAAESALKQHYYENGMADVKKPQKKGEPEQISQPIELNPEITKTDESKATDSESEKENQQANEQATQTLDQPEELNQNQPAAEEGQVTPSLVEQGQKGEQNALEPEIKKDNSVVDKPSIENKFSEKQLEARKMVASGSHNVNRDLSDYTPELHKEISPDELKYFLPNENATGGLKEIQHFADSKNLALGQGENKGILLSFDSNGIEGLANLSKPALKFTFPEQEGEYTTRNSGNATKFKENLKSIEIKPDVKWSKSDKIRAQSFLDKLEQNGWEKKTENDGTVKYTKPTSTKDKVTIEPESKLSEKQGEEGKPADTKKADFDKKVDKIADNLIKKLTPKTTKGLGKQGAGIEEIIRTAAEIIKKAHEIGTDIKEAIEKAIEHIRKNWDKEEWGDFDEQAVRDEMNSVSEGEGGRAVGIKHAATEELRAEYGLGEYERKNATDAQLEAEAVAEIKNGYNYEKLIQKLENGDHPSGVENFILKKYLAELDARVHQDGSNENIDAVHRVVIALDKIGSLQSESFRTRKGLEAVDNSLSGFFIREMETTGVDVLTDEQKARVQKEFDDIKAAHDALATKLAKVEEENAKLKAELEFKKEAAKKKTASGTKKSHSEYVKDREKIIENIRKKLKEARGDTAVTLVPYAKELFSIAPDVLKLFGSLVDEGAGKLGDVVKEIHDTLKDSIDGLTEKDIHNIIAGEYNEKKKTRSDLAIKLRDLRDEAKLINKLETLEAGGEPKAEKAKIQRNKQIKDLQEQIKEHDVTKLATIKSRTEAQIKKVEEDLRTGNFLKEKTKPPAVKVDAETLALKDKLIKLKQDREIRLLKQKYADRTKLQKALDATTEVLNVPRAIMASMDFSAPLRQGLIPTISHPSLAIPAAGEMFRQAFSQKAFDRWFFDVREHPRYELAKESKVYLSDPHDPKLSAKEEQFMTNLAEKIPVIGRFVKGSERAYLGYLNKMRWDLFNRYTDGFEADGKTFENSRDLYKAMGEYVNATTGRGSLGKFEESAQVLNSVFFSPRLIASRMQLLTNAVNPKFYLQVPKAIRVEYFKDMGKFIGVGLATLALAKMGGADVEDDARSSDFGKIKVGDTRYDIWGGFQPYIRLIAQMFTGQRKSPATGAINDLKPADKFGVLTSFARGKLSPVWSTGVNVATGSDVLGQPITVGGEIQKSLLPLIYSDVKGAYAEQGIKSIFTAGVPAAFGIGVQTYKAKEGTLTPAELKQPEWKYLNDKGVDIGQPNRKKIILIDKDTKKERELTDKEYNDFVQLRKAKLKEEIAYIIENGATVRKDEDDDGTPKKAADLTPDELKVLLKAKKSAASKAASEELFPNRKKEIQVEEN